MRVVLAGLDGSGKTTLAMLIMTGKVYEHAPTVRQRTDVLLYKKHMLELVDSSGDAEEVGIVWNDIPCDGYFFIIDGADMARIAQVQLELRKLLTKNRPVAILLNKSDLVNFCPVPELVRQLGIDAIEGKDLPPMQAYECAIGKGLGYQEAIDWLLDCYKSSGELKDRH